MVSIQPQFSIFLVNKPGVLASVTSTLARANVNITALAMMDSVDSGVLRFLCDDPDEARAVLNSSGDNWTETDVVVVEVAHKPGAIADIALKLAKAHISVAYAYVTGGVGDGRTSAVFKLADTKRAYEVLSQGESE